MKIIIDTDELTRLHDEAGKLQLEPEAESTLARIIELEQQIAEIKEAAKQTLLEEGKKLNPNFKSWEADSVKVSMRAYGSKYFVMESEIGTIPDDLYRTEVTVQSPNERIETIIEDLEKAGYPVALTKGKDGTDKLGIKRTVDSKEVDKWVKLHNGLPVGIGEIKDRPISLTFSLKSKEEAE